MAMGQITSGETNTTSAALNNGYESLSGFRDAFINWFGKSPSKSNAANPPIKMSRFLSPLGPLVVAATQPHICLLEFADRENLDMQLNRVCKAYDAVFAPGTNDVIKQLDGELKEYFEGSRKKFTVPLESIGTDFQMTVWSQLQKIPYGLTDSYEQMAKKINKPGAQRAVGRANGDNRLAIVIPCHRIIRSDGSLSGYGGGVWRKKWLLEHEQNFMN